MHEEKDRHGDVHGDRHQREEDGEQHADAAGDDAGPTPSHHLPEVLLGQAVDEQFRAPGKIAHDRTQHHRGDEEVQAVQEHGEMRTRPGEVPGHHARGEGHQGDEEEHQKCQAEGDLVLLFGQLRDGRVRHPDPADEDETDHIGEEVGPLRQERREKVVGPLGNRQFEDEQGDDDRKDPVGEGVQPVGREKVGEATQVGFLIIPAAGRRPSPPRRPMGEEGEKSLPAQLTASQARTCRA